MGEAGQRHPPAALPPGKSATYCIGGWVQLTEGLGGCSPPQPGFDPCTVQPVAIRYTN